MEINSPWFLSSGTILVNIATVNTTHMVYYIGQNIAYGVLLKRKTVPDNNATVHTVQTMHIVYYLFLFGIVPIIIVIIVEAKNKQENLAHKQCKNRFSSF